MLFFVIYFARGRDSKIAVTVLFFSKNYYNLPLGKKPTKKSLKKTYKGYQLLRTYPDVQWKVQEMLDLQEEAQGSGIMWWTPPSLNGTTDLVVPSDLLEDVKEQLKSSQIDYDVVIWDLQVTNYTKLFIDICIFR